MLRHKVTLAKLASLASLDSLALDPDAGGAIPSPTDSDRRVRQTRVKAPRLAPEPRLVLPKLVRQLRLDLGDRKGCSQVELTQRREVPRLELSAFAAQSVQEDAAQSPRAPHETGEGPQLPQSSRVVNKKVLFSKPQQAHSPVKRAQIKTLGSLSNRSGLAQCFKPPPLLCRSPSVQLSPAPHYYLADLRRDLREIGPGLEPSKLEHQHAFFKHFQDCHKTLLQSRGLALGQAKPFEMPPRGTQR